MLAVLLKRAIFLQIGFHWAAPRDCDTSNSQQEKFRDNQHISLLIYRNIVDNESNKETSMDPRNGGKIGTIVINFIQKNLNC